MRNSFSSVHQLYPLNAYRRFPRDPYAQIVYYMFLVLVSVIYHWRMIDSLRRNDQLQGRLLRRFTVKFTRPQVNFPSLESELREMKSSCAADSFYREESRPVRSGDELRERSWVREALYICGVHYRVRAPPHRVNHSLYRNLRRWLAAHGHGG